MSLQTKLEKYAKLIVQAGLNVQKGQEVVILTAIEASELTQYVTKEAYQAGAKEVIVQYHDAKVDRMRYEYGDPEIFTKVPSWIPDFYNEYARNGAAFLSILSDDPEAMKGMDPKKMTAWRKLVNEACQEYRDSLNKGINAWCIVGASSVKWANKVFPDMSDEEAVEALWNAIFKTVKVDQEDPLQAWQEHRRSFERRVKYLNELQLQSLTYTNDLQTNLTIGLNDEYIFVGGGSYLTNGVYTFPNMPTEEIFTSPNYKEVNGIVHSAMPLNYNGSIIDEFYLEFKDGKVVNFDAKVGKDVLKEIIETDEGSHYLGEIALVPFDSPISNMNLLFYNTLYDENAVCHLALGLGFGECIKDGLTMSKEELKAKGINDSLTHVDFMIGTKDLKITGLTKDRKTVDIFIDGNFAF